MEPPSFDPECKQTFPPIRNTYFSEAAALPLVLGKDLSQCVSCTWELILKTMTAQLIYLYLARLQHQKQGNYGSMGCEKKKKTITYSPIMECCHC